MSFWKQTSNVRLLVGFLAGAISGILVTSSWILALTLGGLSSGGVYGWTRWREERQRQLWASQLRASLQNMVHALRVGVGFMQALDRAAQEGQEPLASEWKKLLQAVNFGSPLSAALTQLQERVPIKEMSWFVTAVQITQGTGGSLADVLDTLASTLQERHSLRQKVSALTAQGRGSGYLLSALPFLMMGALYFIGPEFVTPFFTTTLGQCLFAGVLVSVAIGTAVIQKIVAIKTE